MQITDRKININGSIIYYWRGGDPNGQILLFLHGWPGINLIGTGVIQEFSKHFFVIAPEHPGLIRSEPLSSYHNIFEQNAEVAYQILKQEGKEQKKVIVIGQSFGGGIAGAFAYKYPKNTKALVLVDSIIGGKITSLWMKFLLVYGPNMLYILPYLPTFFKRLTLKYVFAAEENQNVGWNALDKSIPQRITMVKKYVSLVHEHIKTNKSINDRNYGAFPILFVWGDKDGKEFNIWGSIPVEFAEELVAKMKREGRNVKLITVDGGHTILYEKPEMVINEIVKNLPE